MYSYRKPIEIVLVYLFIVSNGWLARTDLTLHNSPILAFGCHHLHYALCKLSDESSMRTLYCALAI